MERYNKYNIRETDHFFPENFPKMEAELQELVKLVAAHPGAFTELIIISYLRYHSIKREWSDANPWLSTTISDNSCCTDHLASLFTSARGNVNFTRDYEEYIRSLIANPVLAKTEG